MPASKTVPTPTAIFVVFNTILNFDNLDAGRKLDPR